MQVSCIVYLLHRCVLRTVVRPYEPSLSPTCHRCILRVVVGVLHVVVGVLCIVVGLYASSLCSMRRRWSLHIVVGVLNVISSGNSSWGH